MRMRWTLRQVRLPLAALCVGCAFACVADSARATTVDFSDLASGTLIDDDYESANNPNLAAGEGFTLSVTNASGGPNIGALYDSELTGGEDDDLERLPGGWAGGNLAPNTDLGNLLIIQEDASASELSAGALTFSSGQSNPGAQQWAPDDQFNGGTLTFLFESALDSFAFDFADLDDPLGYAIEFTDTGSGESATVLFSDFEDNTNVTFYDATVAWADSVANRIQPITAQDLRDELNPALTQFDQIRFTFNGSGGLASVTYLARVPEPGTGMLLALGVVGLGLRRRASSTRRSPER